MKSVEQLFPQFQVVNIVRQNHYKKSVIVKRNGYNYMLRIFSLEGIPKDRVQSIIKMLNKLSNHKNPHIVKFYEASFDHDMTYLGIVSQYLDKQYEYPLKEVDIWSIIQELSIALQQFHPKRVHGKLLLSNLFQSKGMTILGELNVLYYLHKQNYQDIYLLAPEFIRSQIYDHKSDIWMVGYMLYQMMFKDPPIITNNVEILHKKILKGIQITYNPNYSLNLNNLLRLMMCYDAELRPNVEQIQYFCQQSKLSNEEININRILPKFKVDKVALPKKKTEKKSEPVQSAVYLIEDQFKQPYFPPSKIKKQKRCLQQKQTTSVMDFGQSQKTNYSVQLPKVLNSQLSKLKVKEASTISGSIEKSNEQEILNNKAQLIKLEIDSIFPQTKITLHTQRKSPNRIQLQQVFQNRQKSQRFFY
ncbi:unnamed protein product (macronuclear) [Paramecium tetraurelia]|uniref:Protein kinase domain-containing protein n=1 Tax=Paramecium tetraurelia TaxID=5888 RepID=A0EIE0_PARTE|nr:uncharacterized protein GSPATT00027410001 [Paramecium tetraurelia]CAK95081.1 unnamed protein product [Paramecium tetraurelia]|eukprot:XP_001462454.1 hypothetical protein (macronuclear) [Paramecium tetraurelia strain d4-2]